MSTMFFCHFGLDDGSTGLKEKKVSNRYVLDQLSSQNTVTMVCRHHLNSLLLVFVWFEVQHPL